MSEAVIRYRSGTYPRGEDTRRRLIDAAIEAFGTYGYDGTSTRMLAEGAGVTLPAIQYYFGSKEGLYRAAIDYIIHRIEAGLKPVADRVRQALAGNDLTDGELLALLDGMLDAFVAVVLDGEDRDSRKRFITRAEIERSVALDPLHESMMRQTFQPCAALVGRLLHQPPDSEIVALRTLSVMGQVSVFCHAGARCALGWTDFNAERILAIQTLVRENARAALNAAREPKQ